MKSTTILLVILLTFLLLVRYFFYFDSREIYKEGEKINLTHSFLQEPRHNSYGQYFFTGNILVSLPLYPKYRYGDKIQIDGVVEKKTNEKGELLIISDPIVTVIKNDNPFLKIAIFVRERVNASVEKVLPSKEGGLFLGIILGVRDRIDAGFYERLRSVGVLHIIAASGQNVSILASILLVSLSTVVKRKIAILFTAVLILFYSMLSGFDPPIVRASIMGILSFGAMIMGRQSAGLYTLAITGWGMIFLLPELITDISFQLSFLSTFGIITVKPILDKLIGLKKIMLLKEDITTTLSAQIATFPVMLASFGSYSLLSLPVNILLLWTVPPIMLSGILGLFASVISPILAKPIVLLAYPMLYYFTFIVDIMSGFDFNFQAQDVPQGLIYGYYLILIAIVIKFRRKERRKI